MEIKKQRLLNLESNCLFYASKAFEYSSDFHIHKDDYSREFVINEFIYSFEVFKRALDINRQINRPGEPYLYLESLVNQLSLSLPAINFENKCLKFFEDYFSETRYSQLLSKLKQQTDLNFQSDNVEKHSGYMALDYFLIFDKINLIGKNKIFEENIILKDHLYSSKEKLTKIFNEYSSLWSYYSLEIKTEAAALLVPKQNEHQYWQKFSSLSVAEIDYVLSYYVKTQLQNKALTAIFDNLNSEWIKPIINIPKSIQGLRDLPLFNQLMNDWFSDSQGQPAFATYSKTKKTEDLNIENLIKKLTIQNKSLESIIDLIEELSINEKDKKELLIAIYLLFNEKEKAAALLK